MDIERPTRAYQHNTIDPVSTLVDKLESFADTIGGPAWRKGRAAKVYISRSIGLHLVEDYEALEPEIQKLFDGQEGDLEELSVDFQAQALLDRELLDDDITAPYTEYVLSYAMELPLAQVSRDSSGKIQISDDIPESVAREICDIIYADSEDGGEDEQKEAYSLSESRALSYTIRIDEEDVDIDYAESIIYYLDGDPIEGASYDTLASMKDEYTPWLENTDIHTVIETPPAKQETIDDPVRSIQTMAALSDVLYDKGDEDSDLYLGVRTRDEYAQQVLGILALVSCNIRPYRSPDERRS